MAFFSHANRAFFLIFLSCLLTPLAGAQCIIPADRMEIARDTIFCQGTYTLNQGLIIANNDITVDCGQSILVGAFSGSGFDVTNKENVTIQNCVIEDFEDSIYLSNSRYNTIKDNTFSATSAGVRLFNSNENTITNNIDQSEAQAIESLNSKFNRIVFTEGTVTENACTDNVCSLNEPVNPCVNNDNYCSLLCTTITDNDCIEETVGAQGINQEGIPEQNSSQNNEQQAEVRFDSEPAGFTPVTVLFKHTELNNPDMPSEEIEEFVNSLILNYLPQTMQNIELDHQFEFSTTDNTTEITFRISPNAILENVSVYEQIPKCVAQALSTIEFDQNNFEVIEEDPLVMWSFPVLEEETLLTYRVQKFIDENCKKLLYSFALAEGVTEFSEKNPNSNEKKEEKKSSLDAVITILILVCLSVLFFIYKMTHKKERFR